MQNSWFDPVLVAIGPIEVRWYGLMYVAGFVIGGWILTRLAKSGFWPLSVEKIDSYVTMLIIGMFLGARSAYVFIYNWDYYGSHLSEALHVWKGGLSFHGAIAGMALSTFIFAKKNGLSFFQISDCMAIGGTPGIMCGRLGNFINGELYGRVTDSPVGIIFPGAGPFPRHASQLYEGVLEGILMFAVLWWMHKRVRIYGVASAFFLLAYGIVRFIVEFFREPDAQLGYYFGGLTMGQLLCLIMVAVSAMVYAFARQANVPNPLAKKAV